MTDISIMKSADSETIKKRVKAIYPHIVVSGDIDKPYYSIHWYDIEKEEMYCGFSSYNLELVRKWLEEEFEVVEADIDNLINRKKAEIERLEGCVKTEEEVRAIASETIQAGIGIIKAEAVKEFAERLKDMSEHFDLEKENFVSEEAIDNLVKEMVGENNAE